MVQKTPPAHFNPQVGGDSRNTWFQSSPSSDPHGKPGMETAGQREGGEGGEGGEVGSGLRALSKPLAPVLFQLVVLLVMQ